MMRVDTMMLKLIDDRPMVEALMERTLQYAAAYGRALADAGADMLSGGDSPAGLIGPQLYRDVALPFAKRLVSELKATVEVPVSLHVCGDATPIVADMAASGADVLELDCQVDMTEACRTVGPNVGIRGNLDTVGLLARGTVEQVRRETGRLIDTMHAAGHDRFVLSSGCTLAMETPPENMHAMFNVAREC